MFLDQYYLDRPCDFSSSGQPAASDQKAEEKSGTGVGTQIAFTSSLIGFADIRRMDQNGVYFSGLSRSRMMF